MASIISAGTTSGTSLNLSGDTSGVLQLATNGSTTAVTIDTSQNVGVGTATPVANANQKSVTINGTSYSRVDFQVSGSNTAYIYSGSTNTVLGTTGSTFIAFDTNATERMRIDSSGIIAMGTTDTSNTTRLKVQSGSTTNRATSAQLSVQRNSSSTQYEGICFVSGVAQSAYILRVPNSDDLTFGFDAGGSTTERMRITSGGDLLVGTTSNYGTARTSINNSGTVLGLYCSGASGQPAFVIGKESNDASTSQVLMQFLYNNGSAGLGQINGNGGSQAAFGSYSDIRLKENVVDLAPQLENIIALRPVEFDYKDGSGHQTGFIAQEIQNVFPEAVSVGHNEMLTVTGWNKTEAILVKAIQEQQAMIETLQAEVAALKGVN